jgi:hypothetical protein
VAKPKGKATHADHSSGYMLLIGFSIAGSLGKVHPNSLLTSVLVHCCLFT